MKKILVALLIIVVVMVSGGGQALAEKLDTEPVPQPQITEDELRAQIDAVEAQLLALASFLRKSDEVKTGSGTVEDSATFNFGTGNMFYSVAGATQGTGYLYTKLDTSPDVSFDDVYYDPKTNYPTYAGIFDIRQFTSAEGHAFSNEPHAIRFGDKNSLYYHGIILFRQGDFFGGIDFEDVDEQGQLHYRYWYKETGSEDFSVLLTEKEYEDIKAMMDALRTQLEALKKQLDELQGGWAIVPPVEIAQATVRLLSPPRILPGKQTEVIRFEISSNSNKEILLSDMCFGFFYDSISKDEDEDEAKAENFSLWIAAEGKGAAGTNLSLSYPETGPVVENPQTIQFLRNWSLLIRETTEFVITADVWGEGTIQMALNFKAFTQDGGQVNIQGLPLEGTVPVKDGEIEVRLNSETPAGEILPGTNRDLIKIDLIADGSVLLDSLSLVIDKLGEIEFGELSLYSGDVLLAKAAPVFDRNTGKAVFDTNSLFVDVYSTLTIRGDIQGRGLFAIRVEAGAKSYVTGKVLPIKGLPLIRDLILSGPPLIFKVPEEYMLQEAISIAIPGDTISIGPGVYQFVGKGGPPLSIISDITIEGSGDGKTFLFGALATKGNAILKNLTLINEEGYSPAISAGKHITLENATVITKYPVAIWADWYDTVLDIQNSQIINSNWFGWEGSKGIEVNGLNIVASKIAGNSFVNFNWALDASYGKWENFSKAFEEQNYFYGVGTPYRETLG